MDQPHVEQHRIGRVHFGRWAAAAVLAAGIGLLLLGGVAGSDSSITVSQDDFELTCPAGTVAENTTLACTLKNTAAEAKPWPVVAILHLSTDADRALVRGNPVDVTLGTPNPGATLDGGVTWIGDTLVGYSRFDWSGNAGANPAQTTTTVGAPGSSRTVNIVANHDSLDEDSEKFYVALGPDRSKGVGILYTNKASLTLTDDDSPSTDTSLSSLKLFAGQSHTLSPTQATQSQTVAYQVTEATVTAAPARGSTMTLSASFGGNSLDLDGRGATSIEVTDSEESAAVPLAVGTTTVTLTVTAEDGITSATHTVNIVRPALGDDVDTVSVSVPSFTLTCPAEVAKATDAQCTLRASASASWPVVAILHSSADGASRALVAEDPIIPETDPNYSKDLSLGEQQPARTAFNYGYGELLSGGSRTLYRTYGYEKFEWSGTASAGAARAVTIRLHDNDANSGRTPEVFYVALAPGGYTGLSQLVGNMVPVVLKELPVARSLAAQNVNSASAEIAVQTRNPAGTLYMRYRAGTSGDWTTTEVEVTSSPARFSITGLAATTQYQVQTSFHGDFSTGVRSGSFTTLDAPSVTGVEVVSDAGEDDTYGSGDTISLRVTFSEAVDVTGTPTLGIDMDPAPQGRKEAAYASGSSTAELMFTHTVIEPDYSSRGIAVLAHTLALNGGTIRAAGSGNDADLTHTGLGHDPAHKVDWHQQQNLPPTLTARNCDFVVTENIPHYGNACTLEGLDAEGDPLTWSLSGADAEGFRLIAYVQGPSRMLFFKPRGAVDFEAPEDADGDNVFEVTVTVSDGDYSASVDATVSVTDVDEPFWLYCNPAQPYDAANRRWTLVEPPLGSTGRALVPESLVAGRCTVDDPEDAAAAYSLSGVDAAMFDISSEGVLSFASAPDFETPADSDNDNIYDVTVTVTAGADTQSANLAVNVIDAPEAEVTIIELPNLDAPIGATVSGNDLTLTFNHDLAAIDDATAESLRWAFVVDGAYHHGSPVANQSPSKIVVDGATVTLTLGTAIAAGDEATVIYGATGAGNSLQRSDGTPMASFNTTLTTTQAE